MRHTFLSITLLVAIALPSFAQDQGGDVTMAVIGFEQAGASGARSDQKFFFDFFTSRPLPFGAANNKKNEPFGTWLRWWGDVRIATYPQQISTPVAQFASTFATQAGSVKVNELAQFGEFRTGLDFRLKAFAEGQRLIPNIGAGSQQSSLSFFVSFGAMGAFNPPSERMDIFLIPAPNSPQAAAFERNFPKATYSDLKLPSTQYVGLTAPDRNRFYRQYGAGFRLTTRFYDKNGGVLPSPAMVGISLGQNELVSGGRLQGLAGKFEGFYPLTIGDPNPDGKFVLYLFGRANLHFGRATEATPLVLQRATGIQADNPAIAVISQPSARDTYTIGVGIDAAQLIRKLTK